MVRLLTTRVMLRRSFFLAVIVLVSVLAYSDRLQGAGTVVLAVDRIDAWNVDRGHEVPGTLVRELGRQAVLIAAREELGLHTRDRALRELGAEGDSEAGLVMTVDARTNGKCEVKLARVGEDDDAGEELLSETFEFKPAPEKAYAMLAAAFEAASRERYVEALKKLNLEAGERKVADGEAEADGWAEVDALLEKPDVISQFAAVRKTHDAIADKGESPAALVRLVRGYAHLGLLTEANWSLATNALKARSLIYAERLVAKYPTEPLARPCRAYAYALAGVHCVALADFGSEDDRAKESDPAEARSAGDEIAEDEIAEETATDEGRARALWVDDKSLPAWTRLIEPTCRFDLQQLSKLAEDESLASWASVLVLWDAYAGSDDRELVNLAKTHLANCPEAYGLHYVLCHRGSVGVMHMMEQASMEALEHGISTRLRETAGVPVAVAASGPSAFNFFGATLAHWPTMLKALADAGDDREMDWPVLGSLLHDAGVGLAATILRSHQGAYQEHSLDSIIATLMPVVDGHQAAGYFRLIVPSKADDLGEFRKLALDVHFDEATRWMYPAYRLTWRQLNNRNEYIGWVGYQNSQRDLACLSIRKGLETVRSKEADQKRNLTREMRAVSPHCPTGFVYEMQYDTPDATAVSGEQIVTWKKLAGNHAAPWNMLGLLHYNRDEYDEAIACYEKAFAIIPNIESIRSLAAIYELQENFDQVVPTYERYLTVEDQGLGHSSIQTEIARFLIRREEYDKAKEHAVIAAGSYSAQGLLIAAYACELAGELEQANYWYSEASRAYPSSSGREWFFFRARSGLPRDADAKRLADEALGDNEKREQEASGWWPIAMGILDGHSKEAFPFARLRVEQTSDIFGEAMLLTMATELGKTDYQTAALAKLRRLGAVRDKANKNWNARFVRTVDAIVAAELADKLPLEEMEALIEDYDATMPWCDAAYFFGKLALLKGFEESGREYLQKAVKTRDSERVTWNLACRETAILKKKATEGDGEVKGAEDAKGDEDGAAKTDASI
jgi:tetratricopeptide (TPR) repeat protein